MSELRPIGTEFEELGGRFRVTGYRSRPAAIRSKRSSASGPCPSTGTSLDRRRFKPPKLDIALWGLPPEVLAHLCPAHLGEPLVIWDDGVSTSEVPFNERPGIIRLLRACADDHLVVWRLDRIERGFLTFYDALRQIVERDVWIHSIEEKGGLSYQEVVPMVALFADPDRRRWTGMWRSWRCHRSSPPSGANRRPLAPAQGRPNRRFQA